MHAASTPVCSPMAISVAWSDALWTGPGQCDDCCCSPLVGRLVATSRRGPRACDSCSSGRNRLARLVDPFYDRAGEDARVVRPSMWPLWLEVCVAPVKGGWADGYQASSAHPRVRRRQPRREPRLALQLPGAPSHPSSIATKSPPTAAAGLPRRSSTGRRRGSPPAARRQPRFGVRVDAGPGGSSDFRTASRGGRAVPSWGAANFGARASGADAAGLRSTPVGEQARSIACDADG